MTKLSRTSAQVVFRRRTRADSGFAHTGGPAATQRLFDLHDLLAAGKPVNAVTFARVRELAPRTVKRDIDVLRNRGAPIEWDNVRKTYIYTAPFDLVSGLRLSAEETLAVILAGRTFAAWGESPLGRTLTHALQKVADFAGSSVSLPADSLRAALYEPDRSDPAADAEHRHFARLLDLIIARREVEILYQKPTASRPERRRIRPLHLAYLDHRWMLVAEDPTRLAWRNFLLARIQIIGPAGERFAAPSREKIRAYLAGSLGRFTGEQLHDVRLHFAAPLASYLREKPWHASQVLHELPDGSVEATLRLNNLIDVQRRVLACGSQVEVLAPPELRARVAAEHRAAAARYVEKTDPGEKFPKKIEPVTTGVTHPPVN